MIPMLKFLPHTLVGAAAFIGGLTFQSKVLTKRCPDLVCPQQAACVCPEPKPCQGIDFDKIKSKNITIQNEQYLTIEGDSLLVKRIGQEVRAELERVRMARCK